MASTKAAITVLAPRKEVEQRWREQHGEDGLKAEFRKAPGERGTEIHVDLGQELPGGKVGALAGKLVSKDPRAKAMDTLRRFKALLEAGEIARSDGTPEGELAQRKLAQRPAQPLEADELEKAGV